jgi:arylsulfatase A-like enzyme/Tfp pilus assembly protein PilF
MIRPFRAISVPMRIRAAAAAIALMALVACQREPVAAKPGARGPRPSILLVTLDTTRADAVGPDARGADTPAFNALSARGMRFRQAYATVPETLPSHASMMTGLYPAGHGVHENGRSLATNRVVLAERLAQSGYQTAAFVSSFVLARRFGLARGFELYDDDLPAGRPERESRRTTDKAIEYLAHASAKPVFVWVHYFDPHAPYEPAEPFRSSYAAQPYLGEVAAMDRQLGRLVNAFDAHTKATGDSGAIAVVSDHGEGLGDHGELQHGNLLYQSTMHVPLLLVGPGVTPGHRDTPVSTRRIFHTVLDWAGIATQNSLRSDSPDVALGEAMKPFLEYGWQPQTMAVAGRHKAIVAGTTEVYDVVGDPRETRNLGAGANLPGTVRQALDDYPLPSLEGSRTSEALSEEARQSLASLGYVGSTATPAIRKDAPRPANMVHLFEALEKASTLFVQERYTEAIPVLSQILAEDAHNLDTALRLATAHSALGQEQEALEAFRKAASIAPRSPDVRLYLALHYARGRRWERAEPELERILAETPDRLPALEALGRIRERQGRPEEAVAIRQRIYGLRTPSGPELAQLGRLAMAVQRTPLAIDSFERARTLLGDRFTHDLELGVLYLAAGKFSEARQSLDRVPPSHPEYPMALFKRAQVSVLLNEADRGARIESARRRADPTTRELIRKERLFQGIKAP